MLSIDLALYNELLYAGKHQRDEVQNTPHLLLIHSSIGQSVIVKNAILLERVMDFIYFLEFKEKLENVYSNLKFKAWKEGKKPSSKRKIFFKKIKSTKWKYLADYKKVFKKYKEKLRTPEVHLSSQLANRFNRSEELQKVDFEQINVIHSFISNMFWQPLLRILKGEEIKQVYWSKGMETLAGVTPEDLEKMLR